MQIPISKYLESCRLRFWNRFSVHCLDTPGKRSTCTPSVYYRNSIWPVSADQLTFINKHAAERISKFNVSLYFISILTVNRRMSYAVAMNVDNTHTGITWKKSEAVFRYYIWHIKNRGFKTLCRDSICLCYATLSFFVGYYQSKQKSDIKCLFKILLVIWYASIPRRRPKTFGRNVWSVASNLTSRIHCGVMFHLIVLEFGYWTVENEKQIHTIWKQIYMSDSNINLIISGTTAIVWVRFVDP